MELFIDCLHCHTLFLLLFFHVYHIHIIQKQMHVETVLWGFD